jgi:hypothetical protein
MEVAEKEATEKQQEIQRRGMTKQDLSKEARAALQQYLVDLIRAVVSIK